MLLAFSAGQPPDPQVFLTFDIDLCVTQPNSEVEVLDLDVQVGLGPLPFGMCEVQPQGPSDPQAFDIVL
jgi:hypothetical protein